MCKNWFSISSEGLRNRQGCVVDFIGVMISCSWRPSVRREVNWLDDAVNEVVSRIVH